MSCVLSNIGRFVLTQKMISKMSYCKTLKLHKWANNYMHSLMIRSQKDLSVLIPLWLLNTRYASCRQTHNVKWWDSDTEINNSKSKTSYQTGSMNGKNEESSPKAARKIAGSVVLYEFRKHLDSGEHGSWTDRDWEEFENSVSAEDLNMCTQWEGVCMNLLFHHGEVESGLSLMKYIKDKGRLPKLTTWTAFIALCGWHGGEKYQDIVLETYREVLEFSDVFDSQSCKQLIYGLCSTDRWREAIPLLEMTQITQTPTASFYTPIILAALRHRDICCVLQMLDTVGDNNLQPQTNVFLALVEFCKVNTNLLTFHQLFDYLRKYMWFPSTQVMQALACIHESEEWQVSWTKMDAVGRCRSCGYTAPSQELDTQQFQELRDGFLEKAVISGDVFMKSNPAEMKKFYGFIKDTAPYDVVLDSLNIVLGRASKRPTQEKADVLLSAVDFFWRKQQKVLVLGRKHLQSWPKKKLSLIHKKANCFYTDNMSADDPLMLYAALYSGPLTLIVSNDEMRDHKHLLGTKLGAIFAQWQRSRQVFITGYDRYQNKIQLLMPKTFDTLAQKHSDGWHIPYENMEDRSSYQHPNAWLCLRQTVS